VRERRRFVDQWHLELITSGFWTRIEAVGERELEVIFQEDGCIKNVVQVACF